MEIHNNGGTPKLTDSVDFPLPGFREFNVQKDILLFGGDAPATLSFVDQTFSQTLIVPEPNSLFLICIGFGLATSLFGTFDSHFKK